MQQLKFEIRGLDNKWQFPPLDLRFFEDEPACFRPDSGLLPRGCVSAENCYNAIIATIHSALFGRQTKYIYAYRINVPQDGSENKLSENTLPLQIKLSAIGDTYVHKDRFDRLCDELLREISDALQDLHVYRIYGGEFQEISIVITDVHPKRYETFPLPNGFTYQPQQNKAIQLLVEVADHVQYKELQVPSLGLVLVGTKGTVEGMYYSMQGTTPIRLEKPMYRQRLNGEWQFRYGFMHETMHRDVNIGTVTSVCLTASPCPTPEQYMYGVQPLIQRFAADEWAIEQDRTVKDHHTGHTYRKICMKMKNHIDTRRTGETNTP